MPDEPSEIFIAAALIFAVAIELIAVAAYQWFKG